jgi:hypothetical protein
VGLGVLAGVGASVDGPQKIQGLVCQVPEDPVDVFQADLEGMVVVRLEVLMDLVGMVGPVGDQVVSGRLVYVQGGGGGGGGPHCCSR